MRRLVAAVVVGWLTVLPAAAEPVAREQVPEALRPWTDWVMHGHEEAFCSLLQGSTDHRQCAWPSRLTLDLDTRAGRFTQDWLVQRAGWVPLPGDPARAPLDVRADGKPAAVTFRSGVPSVRLERGAHTVSGVFEWDSLPELLSIPAETGLVSLALNGKPVVFPNRDPQGQLWLQRRAVASTEESRLDVVVHRRVIDDIPLQLVTRIELKVAGPGRETLLGRALPDGFVPLSLTSPLPSRLEPDGHLRVQVRPGTWVLELAARHEGPASASTHVPGRTWTRRWPSGSRRLGSGLVSESGTKPSGSARPSSVSRPGPATLSSMRVTSCSGMSSITRRWTTTSSRLSSVDATARRWSQSWPCGSRFGKATGLPLSARLTRPVSTGIERSSGRLSHSNTPLTVCAPRSSRTLGTPLRTVTAAGFPSARTSSGARAASPGSGTHPARCTSQSWVKRPARPSRSSVRREGQAHWR